MTKRGAAIVLGLMVLVVSCDRNPFNPPSVFSVRLDAADGARVDLSSLGANTASVFVFVAPDCPLSQNYTLTLNNLADQFASDSVRFYGVITGNWFDQAEIDDFATTYQTRFPILLDDDFVLAELFDATVTPEVFTIGAGGAVLYKGAIDDWGGELGRHRTVITAHYLQDALTRIVLGRRPEIIATQATGCFIERLP